MIWKPNLTVLGLSLVIIGGAFAFGYYVGESKEIQRALEAKQALQEEILDLSLDLDEKNAEILRLSREREGLINELENQAVEADGSGNPGVGSTGGLQRLEQRWGSSPATSK